MEEWDNDIAGFRYHEQKTGQKYETSERAREPTGVLRLPGSWDI